jgi:lysophospholipase L1-like esterase
LVVGPPPMPDLEHTQRIGAFSRRLAHLCDELALAYLETFGPLQTSDDWVREVVANDGSHPQAAGYAALANLVQHWAGWRGWFT